jgi:hypothetical protein
MKIQLYYTIKAFIISQLSKINVNYTYNCEG